jgi:hypothetical protein
MPLSNSERQRRHKVVARMKCAAFDAIESRQRAARRAGVVTGSPEMLFIVENEMSAALDAIRAQKIEWIQNDGM